MQITYDCNVPEDLEHLLHCPLGGIVYGVTDTNPINALSQRDIATQIANNIIKSKRTI